MFIFLCLCFLTVHGVFGDEVKSVSVMEGDSVTLHTDVAELHEEDVMMWSYGPENTFVARINGKTKLSDDKRFRDKVMLNPQTGDLTISDSKAEHTGLHTLQTRINNKVSYRKFNVTVYARLPVPVISSNSSQSSSSSSSNCSLSCSVMNVRDVSLSWYKGNSLLSIISVSDLNIRLSLPLEVEYQDTNTYRCVVSNPISNQTQHLNIKELCQTCSGVTDTRLRIWICPVAVGLMIAVGVLIFYVYRKLKGCFMKAKTNVTDEESSINSSSTSEDGEDSRFLNGRQKSDIDEGPA